MKRKRPTHTRPGQPRDRRSELALRLRRLRDEANLTQEALARRSHVTAKFVSQIEGGSANPSVEVLARLVEDGLQLPLSAFFADHQENVRDDLAQAVALLGAQPATKRRLALRVLRVLCADSED